MDEKLEKTQNEAQPLAQIAAPSRDTILAHRLLVMWLFIASLVLCVVLLSAVLYSLKTHRNVVTILLVVIAAGSLGGK